MYVVTASEESFPTARRPVWRAPALLEALGVTWPPFYVALNDDPLHVVAEGVVFAPEQIASELAAT